MAIITAFDDVTVTVIEGDLDNAVAQTQYSLEDPAILGYGIVTEADGIVVLDTPATRAAEYTVWLDGTDGSLKHLNGSPNTAYTVEGGSLLKLPSEWTSPTKYAYKLRGWYNVSTSTYYPAGSEMEVTGNAVLYADWVAATYDIGEFNAQVADTVSTNSFITTHLFDYNYLFNAQSSNAQVTVSNRSHSETWSMVTSGTVNYANAQTLDYIFAEADSGGRLSNPNNRSQRNTYRNADTISAGICTPEMRELLYSTQNAFNPATGEGIIGKTYLGTADHLFQIMNDPNDAHYGYYYYDSLKNALSYNQTNGRFYVYEYLSATSDAIGSSYADFLPLNSPYANTNGRTMRTYTYNGQDGEYQGVTHYRYDTSESDSGVYTEFAYGMRSDINFFLPNDPGSGGNKDLNGNDIKFEFSGDDDLWVLIDGIVVLDIGGIHQRIAGDINFSTGEVVVNNRSATSLQELGITSGDHTLTVLYLERGASMSNCSIYFNLVPRVGLEIEKEDVLTQEPLDGTQFTVYEDFECTKPAELWESEAAYLQDFADDVLNEFQSTFTVKDGVAKLWGLGAGSTYYIKETGPPGKAGYGLAQGVIRLTIDKDGQATYHVDVVADAEGNGPSVGFTVHGVSIDETTQTVYLVVTNAPETVIDTTTVQVIKKWEDTKSHSGDYIQAYLTVTDPDGTVRRIREITLSDENKWTYTWTNLPKYDYTALTEVKYGVEESYESGYYSTVRRVTQIEISSSEWAEAGSFVNGEAYVAVNDAGYVTWNAAEDDDTVAAFAKLALKYAQDNSISPIRTSANTADYTVSGTAIKFSELSLGYYLVDSTMGALCGLTTTNPNASINAKNGAPTLDKQVQEDSTGNWGGTNSADIGQTVNFRTTIAVHAGAQNYVLHDVFSDGFAFDKITDIRHVVPGTTDEAGTVVPEDYYTINTAPSDGCTFEIVFTQEFCDHLETNDKVIVFYDAALNENADINGEGNPNESWLVFGENANGTPHTTAHDITYTYTYGIDIVKTNSQNILIDGAKFKIYDALTGGSEVAVTLMADGTYRRNATITTGDEISVPDGKVRVTGLDNGTYYLEETQNPDGYNKLTARQKFIISDGNLDAVFNDDVFSVGSGVHVVNKAGSMLPETGGLGTLLFTVLGGGTALGTGVVLVTKKRMSKIEDED